MTEENQKTCAICLGELQKTNITITQCNHTFCTSCLLENIHVNNTCPICRRELTRPVKKIECFCPTVQSYIANDVYAQWMGSIEIYEWLETLNIDTTIDNVDSFMEIVDSIITSTLSQTELYLDENITDSSIPPVLNENLSNEYNPQSVLVEDLVEHL